jgi:hypothetical protein
MAMTEKYKTFRGCPVPPFKRRNDPTRTDFYLPEEKAVRVGRITAGCVLLAGRPSGRE